MLQSDEIGATRIHPHKPSVNRRLSPYTGDIAYTNLRVQAEDAKASWMHELVANPKKNVENVRRRQSACASVTLQFVSQSCHSTRPCLHDISPGAGTRAATCHTTLSAICDATRVAPLVQSLAYPSRTWASRLPWTLPSFLGDRCTRNRLLHHSCTPPCGTG